MCSCYGELMMDNKQCIVGRGLHSFRLLKKPALAVYVDGARAVKGEVCTTEKSPIASSLELFCHWFMRRQHQHMTVPCCFLR